jgi:uncharacterized protein YcbX
VTGLGSCLNQRGKWIELGLMNGKLKAIYRHLIKGLRPESAQSGNLLPNVGLEWDRAFAFKHVVTRSADLGASENHPWIVKKETLTQHDFPALARVRPLWKPPFLELHLDETSAQSITKSSSTHGQPDVRADISTMTGRQKIEEWMYSFVSQTDPFEKAYHPTIQNLELIGNSSNSSTRYTDGKVGPVSFAFEESLRALESLYGHEIDIRRFRINLILTGGPAWSELSWGDKKLRVGNALLQVTKPIARCPNIDVDPESGDRVDPIFSELKVKLGHPFFGMKAEVLQSADISIGESWALEP